MGVWRLAVYQSGSSHLHGRPMEDQDLGAAVRVYEETMSRTRHTYFISSLRTEAFATPSRHWGIETHSIGRST